jgi:hypothetical protein
LKRRSPPKCRKHITANERALDGEQRRSDQFRTTAREATNGSISVSMYACHTGLVEITAFALLSLCVIQLAVCAGRPAPAAPGAIAGARRDVRCADRGGDPGAVLVGDDADAVAMAGNGVDFAERAARGG